MTPQTVLVTGSSSGIGLATCVELARREHRVIASMRHLARAGRLHAALDAAGVADRVAVVRLDVGEAGTEVEAAVGAILSAHGPVDALVNNAGVAALGPVETVPDSEWRRVIGVNLLGAAACIRACLPSMRERGHGTIVNVSSVNGRVPAPGAGAYVASKFALEGLSEALRLEVAPFGVRVVLVQPGQYATDIWARDYGLVRDSASPYAAVMAGWLALEGAPPGAADDPVEVGRLVADVIAHPDPVLRHPVGRVGRHTVDEAIRRHLAPAGPGATGPVI